MSSWLETASRQCRGAEKLDSQLIDANIIWEDSTVGESGKVFFLGATYQNQFFYGRWTYDTFANSDTLNQEFVIFDRDLKDFKAWLRQLRDSDYEKKQEVLNIARFFLT
jgi:hypothetical protein